MNPLHPQGDGDAFLFLANGNKARPLTPLNFNKKLRLACKKLGIAKRITAYSLKRNGVTFCRLRGDSDVEIQHRAGWTSTKQLQTYDLPTPEDAFQQVLARRGIDSKENEAVESHEVRTCVCGARVGFADKVCSRCKRSADTTRVEKDMKAEGEIREILALALQQPDRSLAEVMDLYRQKRMDKAVVAS